MSSTVTSYSNLININYPIPGADNDSQGFRNNFSRIQSAFNIASDEITSLQVNSVNLSTTNDFGNNVIKKAALQGESQVVDIHGDAGTGLVEVDYAVGGYHTFSVSSGTHTFNVTNWPPTGKCGTVRLEITTTSTDATNIAVSGVSIPLSRTSAVTYKNTGTYIWDVWSPDNGTTVYATEVGKTGIKVDGNGNVYTTVPGTTGMTDGFFYVPAAAGTPTGVPTAIAGFVPMYYDTTNNKFYVYNGGWKSGTLT